MFDVFVQDCYLLHKLLITVFVFSVVGVNVTITSTPVIEGENAGMIQCFYFNILSAEPPVSWTKNNLLQSNSSIQTIYTTCNHLGCNSSLVFQQVNLLTEG